MAADAPAARLRMAFDLFELGDKMMRARLRREHPDWTDAEVQTAIEAWLSERPGAEFGDCPGRRVTAQERLGEA
ncbi:MAG: hypothetical protein Q4G43_12555 [Mobilicoccus sp.]|nr:hypothetical protein [Mobilicoccus sp.]